MIRFYGVSDDLIEVEGPGIGVAQTDWDTGTTYYTDGDAQEHDHWSAEAYTLTVFDVGDKLTVTALFTPDGTWSFGYVTYLKDGVEAASGLDCRLPRSPWPIIIKPRSDVRGYSQELVIEAPEGTKVRRVA